jgi:aminoglycoside 6'-N-acetyltransferase I
MGATTGCAGVQLIGPRDGADAGWLALRGELWPEESKSGHLSAMVDALARGHHVRLAVTAAGDAVAFVEAAVRRDYVNGTATSPVAFLEGIYVAPAWRRRGIARALVNEVIAWAQAQELSELASDALCENDAAHAVHRSLGFKETERVVYFLRSLRP